MNSKYSLLLLLLLFLIVLTTNCKEEAIVEQNNKTVDALNKTLAKENIVLSQVADSLIQKEKKDKIAKLKKEHEKPYVVIEKPEKILSEKLKSRNNYKTLFKNNSANTVQSSQSCYTMEIDVWALVKYHQIPGLIVGIWPKGSYNYPDNLYWQYNQNTLSLLRNTYGFYKVGLERAAINANTIYQANEIMALIDGCYPSSVWESYSNYNGSPLWGCYTDEPFSRTENPMPDGEFARYRLNSTKTWWKQKFGQNSYFIVGETTTSYTSEIVSVSDYVNCSWYGYYLWPLTNDQRSRWTDFNNSFGYKFNHLWISGELDRGEMDQLIGHAQNMGKNGIWLYAAELGMSDQSYWDAIVEFDYYAFIHGYLGREERRFIYVYYYVGYDDPCYDYQITSWELGDIIDTGETRILSN